MASMTIDPDGPFDLALSLTAAASFYPIVGPVEADRKVVIAGSAGPVMINAHQVRLTPPRLKVSASHEIGKAEFELLARRLISADLDLRPFYRIAADDARMASVIAPLFGLKPLPPPSIFETAVIAITEQQLSMTAAHSIRSRIVRRFGQAVGDLWLFPDAERLAGAPDQVLADCGLSRQKIGYVKALASRISHGGLDLEVLRSRPDDEVRSQLKNIQGFGPWSVEHVLLYGFGRPAALPATDISLQKVVGQYLAQGRRLSAAELQQTLEHFGPFQGLAAFYLSVAYRL
jgi:DNA-3-methyladenine glycosylase II